MEHASSLIAPARVAALAWERWRHLDGALSLTALLRPHSRVLPQVNFGILTADAFLAGGALLFALPGMVVAAGLSTFPATGGMACCG